MIDIISYNMRYISYNNLIITDLQHIIIDIIAYNSRYIIRNIITDNYK